MFDSVYWINLANENNQSNYYIFKAWEGRAEFSRCVSRYVPNFKVGQKNLK